MSSWRSYPFSWGLPQVSWYFDKYEVHLYLDISIYDESDEAGKLILYLPSWEIPDKYTFSQECLYIFKVWK